MIQRIQSLYLALAAIAAGLLFFLPMGVFAGPGHYFNFTIWGVMDSVPGDAVFPRYYTMPLLIINAALVVMPIYILFCYRKRNFQYMMIRLSILIDIAMIALLFIFYWTRIESIAKEMTEIKIGVFMPLIELVLLFLAMRGVKKDMELVRSAERIR